MADTPKQPDLRDEAGPGAGAEALMRTMRMGFGMLGGLIVLLVGVYVFSGMFYVEPDEEALVLRFGEISGDAGQQAIQSGSWKWAFPRPVDEIVRIPVRQSRTVESTQFWYKDASNIMNDPSKPQGPSEGPLVPGDDGYLISGDGNVFHAQWNLSYQVENPVAWYSRYAKPEVIVRQAFDNAILIESAGRSIDDILYSGAEDLRLAVQERLVQRLAALEVGVAVRVVTFEKRVPPRSVQATFTKVLEVEQEQSTRVSQASKYKAETIQRAHGEASRRVAEAQSYRMRVVSEVEADVKYFSSLLPKYKEAPDTMLLSLYTETLKDVMVDTKRYVVHSRPGAEQEVRVNIGPEKKNPNSADPPEQP